jgi:hypothetical protein
MRLAVNLMRATERMRLTWFTSVAVALASAVLTTQQAAAGPPFVTDDPEPVEKGHGEFYIASQDFWARDGYSGTLPHFEFNYGPIDNVQLHIIAPMAYDRPRETGTMQYGYGDTELGVKWRFIQEDQLFKGCPQVGVFPLLELPTGSESRGLGNGEDQIFLPLWLQKSWGEEKREWTLYGGGGYWINHGTGNKDFTFAGVALQRQVTDNLTLGGEVFHSTARADDQAAHTGVNIGGIYDFSDHWHFLFSVGRDLKGDNLLTTYLAIQWTF